MILNINIINKHISVEIEISKYEKVGSGSGVARGVGHIPAHHMVIEDFDKRDSIHSELRLRLELSEKNRTLSGQNRTYE